MAAALHNNKVTRSWCCFWTTGKMCAVKERTKGNIRQMQNQGQQK